MTNRKSKPKQPVKQEPKRSKTLNEAIKRSAMIFPAIIGILVSTLGIFTTYQKIGLKPESKNVTAQVENLNKMSEGLRELQTFIEEQKKNLVSEEKALESLKAEKENLEPLVEADKKILEAVFIEQEKRQQKSIWYERAFGFFIGIFSSLVASLIFLWLQRKSKINTEQNNA